METIQITKEAARSAHKEADQGGKKLLENLLGKKHFQTKVTERIKSFEDACEELGEDPSLFNVGLPDEIAYKKLKVIARALNGTWKPDWNNGGQLKWAPWFYMDSPGFRFGDSCCSGAASGTAGGSRLCFASDELATYAGKQFLDLYKAFLS